MARQVAVNAMFFAYLLRVTAQSIEDAVALRDTLDDAERLAREDIAQSRAEERYAPPLNIEGRDMDSED